MCSISNCRSTQLLFGNASRSDFFLHPFLTHVNCEVLFHLVRVVSCRHGDINLDSDSLLKNVFGDMEALVIAT